jgi:hypothetical protein
MKYNNILFMRFDLESRTKNPTRVPVIEVSN